MGESVRADYEKALEILKRYRKSVAARAAREIVEQEDLFRDGDDPSPSFLSRAADADDLIRHYAAMVAQLHTLIAEIHSFAHPGRSPVRNRLHEFSGTADEVIARAQDWLNKTAGIAPVSVSVLPEGGGYHCFVLYQEPNK